MECIWVRRSNNSIGWAIEGAIGSLRKIDASYLSPNVNIAARLEQACHQYNVPILFSQKIFQALTKRVKYQIKVDTKISEMYR